MIPKWHIVSIILNLFVWLAFMCKITEKYTVSQKKRVNFETV